MKDKGSNHQSVRWTTVALPAEHGSWGLALEPIGLGLLLAPSWSGAFLAIGELFAFFAYQPLRIVIKSLRQNVSTPRSLLARKYLVIYGLASAIFMAMSFLATGWTPLLPTLFAAPLLILFLLFDLDGPKRSWQAEISAPIVFSSIAAGIALAAGWQMPDALALWIVMAARGVPSVLYVRARLRLEKGKTFDLGLILIAHLLGLAVTYFLVEIAMLPWLAIMAMLVLLTRAWLGLSRFRRSVRARTIGFAEIGLGVFTVLIVFLGFTFNI